MTQNYPNFLNTIETEHVIYAHHIDFLTKSVTGVWKHTATLLPKKIWQTKSMESLWWLISFIIKL